MRDRSTARGLVWVALAGQAAFVASWVIAGALESGYSGTDQFVSELAARTAEHPAIVMAGIVALGLSFAALGVALASALPRRRPALLAAGLFVAAGALTVAGGAFQLDCEIGLDPCHQQWEDGALSWRTAVHAWTGFAGHLLLMLTPFAIAWALWPAPSGAAALGAGFFGLVFRVLSVAGDGAGAGDGLVQRIGLFVIHLWVLIVAIGILHETRRPPLPGRLIPIRPRDFLAREWAGEGEFLPWPFALGRRIARPFRATREATWVSDRVWRFDDRAHFGDGRVLHRRTFCEFVSDDHVRLTAGDLPDGGDVWIEEGGYRMTPFRMAFPIGPVPVPVRVHDQSYAEPDGTFVNVFEARTLVVGLPIARVVFRVRPVEEADAELRRPESEVPA